MVDRGIHSGYKNTISSPMHEYPHILITGIHSHLICQRKSHTQERRNRKTVKVRNKLGLSCAKLSTA